MTDMFSPWKALLGWPAAGHAQARSLIAGKAPAAGQLVDPRLAELAYADSALPIGEGRTISQPFVAAMLVEAAEIVRGDRVLDVGTGSG